MMTSSSLSPASQRDSATAVANVGEHPLHLSYQGWSGFVLTVPSAPNTASLVLDPAPDVALPAHELVIAITHGHPEHVQGAAAHLKRGDREPVTVVGSKHVCRYLTRRSAHQEDRFQPVCAGDEVEVRGWRINIFAWTHMALLPPSLGEALAHLFKLLRHPVRLLRIGLQSMKGPRHAPMLGYRIATPVQEATLVYYGEGLHRRTSEHEFTAALGEPHAHTTTTTTTLLAGIEPEDEAMIPALLTNRFAGRVILFEPHKGWREQFGMTQVDMPHLLTRLKEEANITATAPPPGTNLTLV